MQQFRYTLDISRYRRDPPWPANPTNCFFAFAPKIPPAASAVPPSHASRGALGFTETQVMHLALRKLAQEVLPAYEADDGAVRADTLRALKKREPQRRLKSVASSIIR